MTDVLTGFQILFPDMPVDYFLMFFTFRAFGKIRTVFTDAFITLVFFVTIPVCCPISKNLIRRTDIAVIVLIIDILIFLEESIFCHGPFIRKQGLYPVF